MADYDIDSSGPNSPHEPEQGKKTKKNTSKRLRNLEDNSTSLFMSDFDPKQVRPSNVAPPSSVFIKYECRVFCFNFCSSQGRQAKLKKKTPGDGGAAVAAEVKRQVSKKESLFDGRGLMLESELDLCDCLTEGCPGCHFPCPRCRYSNSSLQSHHTALLCCGRSAKCGHECRNHRKWVYDSVEQDGVPDSTRENHHKPGKQG